MDTRSPLHPSPARTPETAQPAISPTVSIIVPVHTGGSAFRLCVESIGRCDPRPLEVVAVADGDGDGSWRIAEELGARVLRIPGPGGPARARNHGARAAAGQILFFLDADVVVPPGAVGRVAAAFRADPGLSAVIGSYDDAPADPGFLSQYRNLLHHYVHQTAAPEGFTFWGACGAIRREVFSELRGFDESYRRPCIEDIEFGYRLRSAGYRVRLDKDLQVKHLKRWTALAMVRTDLRDRAIPWTDLILRTGVMADDLNLKKSNRVSVALAGGLAGALLAAPVYPSALALGAVAAGSLLWLNRPLYGFLSRKRGALFALKALPWHWLFYFYSGIAFALAGARYALDRTQAERPEE